MSIKTLARLTPAQRKELKKGVIEVEAKAMNATALGVVDALLKMYPRVTFAELKEMLPDEINPGFDKFGNANEFGKKYDSLFKPNGERLYGVIQPGSIRKESEKRNLILSKSHFTGPGQTFETSDGIEVLVSYKWERKDFVTGECDIENLIKHVEQYGVKVVSFESTKPFKKGEYTLNVINPALLQTLQSPPRKKLPWWIFVLIGLIVTAILLFLLLNGKEKEEIVLQEKIVLPVVPEEDSIESPLEEIKNQIISGENTEGKSVSFHEILFRQDSDVLMSESIVYLNEVLDVMNEIPKLKLLIVGHTSSEGDEKYNKKLSRKRALAVAGYLQDQGIDDDRLYTSGIGSDKPVASNSREEGRKLNRRIEFVIVDDGVDNN